MLAAVNDSGEVTPPRRLDCSDTAGIIAAFEELQPFRAVVETTGIYRWLYKLLAPLGTVLLAHPLRLYAMVARRCKTDWSGCPTARQPAAIEPDRFLTR